MKTIYTIFVVAALFLIAPAISSAATVTTFATLPAQPTSIVFDTAGNLYATNFLNNAYPFTQTAIMKITPSGTVTTFAALNFTPETLVIDTAGNLYTIYRNSPANPPTDFPKIMKITPSGAVSTFATITSGSPANLAFDNAGNLYMVNLIYGGPYNMATNGTISKITPSGTVTTFATVCVMPGKLVFDTAGNLYTGCNNDYANTSALGTISKVTPSGTVSTFATLGIQGYGVPVLAFDSVGNLYATDGSVSLKKFTPSGTVTTLGAYQFYYPSALAVDTLDNIYVANYGGSTITKVTPSGTVAQFVYLGGIDTPQALAFDSSGNLYTANYSSHTIKKISSKITVASNISSSWTITGPATITGSGTSQSSLSQPPGTYTITWGAVSGRITPATQSFTLDSMGDISFSGTYSPSPCTLPWGGSINSGNAVTAYQASSVACGLSCSSQTRTCTTGILSGTYTNQSCSVSNPVGYGNACTSAANSCGQTQSNGTIQCNSSCSSTPPANPAYYGSACTGATSAPNICGQTNPGGAGTFGCAGTNAQSNCSGVTGTTPSNSNCSYTLTVDKVGSGYVNVIAYGSSSWVNLMSIDCGTTCSTTNRYGTRFTLDETSSPGYTFTGWSGCSSTGVATSLCNVDLLSNTTVTATFSANPPTIDLKVNGSDNPSAVNSPANLAVSWTTTNSSQLTSCTGTGQGWNGSKAVIGGTDSGGNLNNISAGTYTYSITCTKSTGGTITDSVNITVNGYTFAVTKSGPGTITSNPAGINCGSTCSASFSYGTSITLTATSDTGYILSNWTGCDSTSGDTCTVSVNGAENVSATFAAKTLTVSLSASPSTGSGSVASTLTATVGGTASGSINYALWWNCNETTTNIASAIAICGSLPSPSPGTCVYNSVGAKCDGLAATNQIFNAHTYSTIGTFYPKVIVERDNSVPNATFKTTVTVVNQPPTANNLSTTQSNYCRTGPAATFNWTFSDPDAGDTQGAYQVQVATNPGFSGPSIVADSGKVSSVSNSYATGSGKLVYNQTYYWRVMVWDNSNLASAWTNGTNFATPLHVYPTVKFNATPLSPSVDEMVQLTDQTTGGAAITSWTWTIPDATYQGGTNANSQNPKVKFSSAGTKPITLVAKDVDNYQCSNADNAASLQSIRVKLAMPGWKETGL